MSFWIFFLAIKNYSKMWKMICQQTFHLDIVAEDLYYRYLTWVFVKIQTPILCILIRWTKSWYWGGAYTLLLLNSFTFFFFAFFRVTAMAYGSSQDRGWIGAVAAGLRHSHSSVGIQAASANYTTVHGNTGSLTHWARKGIKPASSWILVGFVSTEPWWELLNSSFALAKGWRLISK